MIGGDFMFPWSMLSKNNQMNDWMKKINDTGIEQNFEKIFSRFTNDSLKMDVNSTEQSNHATQLEMFETNEFVFIKIPLTDRQALDKLKISYGFNKLFVEGLVENGEKQVLLLPAVVRKKEAEVYFQDSLLEIKLPKHLDTHLVDIDLSSL